ncbi:MAG: hypothetical protein EBY26_00330 [Microbacteriaceae bacterium]|nr:hypothetical protein [Microbacteriaceae bacterium]
MAHLPANQRMWQMLISQARARGWKFPSPVAAVWVHQHYVQLGGKFVESTKDIDPRFKQESPREAAERRQKEYLERGKKNRQKKDEGKK